MDAPLTEFGLSADDSLQKSMLNISVLDVTLKEHLLDKSTVDNKIGSRRLLGRSFKLGMAFLLVLISLRAITSEQGYIGTNNAVLSSQITMLRAPIEGYVTTGKLAAGNSVERSAIVETILNARRNDMALADLEGELRRFLKQHQAALS